MTTHCEKKHGILRLVLWLFAAGLVMAASSPAWAQSSDQNFAEFTVQAQWKNFSKSAGLTIPPNTQINFKSDSGFGTSVGPVFRFIFIPKGKLWGADNKFRIDYGWLNRDQNFIINRTISIPGRVILINSNLDLNIKTKDFRLAYSPRWGNDKFRIGPLFEYEHLSVNLNLTNLTPGAPPPINTELNVPNNILNLGYDFDITPSEKVDIYGFLGVIPCCGGGWHGVNTEYGVKFYPAKHFGINAGFRYSNLRFEGTVNGITFTSKLGGIGPLLGATVRF